MFETYSQIANNLSSIIHYSLDLEYFNRYITNVDICSLEEIKDAAKNRIIHNNLKYVIVGDRNIVLSQLNSVLDSDIIELETGYYIFKLTGRAPAQVAALQDVKDEINDKLFRTKFRQRFIEWIDKLKEDAFIEIKE